MSVERIKNQSNLDVTIRNLGIDSVTNERLAEATIIQFRKAEFKIPEAFKGNLNNIPTNEVAKKVTVISTGKSLLEAQNNALTLASDLMGLE